MENVPFIGSGLSLMFPPPSPKGTTLSPPTGFSGILRVADVIFSPIGLAPGISVYAADVVLSNSAEAEALAKYLEAGYGLHGDRAISS